MMRLALPFLSMLALGAQEVAGPIDPAEARSVFAEAKALSDREGGRLWGRLLYGPMLFADARSRQVVADRQDPEGRLREAFGVWVGTLPDPVGVANTGLDWSGLRWTMLAWPLPERAETRGWLLLHECFHRLQPDLAVGAGASLPAEHLAECEGRIWLQLEWRALEAALVARGAAQASAIRDALLFRAARRSRFAGAAERERGLELNEGLAEYTGVRAHAYSPAQATADALVALRRGADQANPARSFAYASGPAYGLLLDARRPGWRKTLGPGSDLGDLLAGAVAFRVPADPAAAAARRAATYRGDALRAEETRREVDRLQQLAALQARFLDGPVLRLPGSGALRYGFDPGGAVPLAGVGTVFTHGSASDAWGVLEAEDGYLALQGAQGIEGFQVPAPPDPAARPLRGPGWTLKLHPDWVLIPGPRSGDWKVAPAPQ